MPKKTVKIFNLQGKQTGKIELPIIFSTHIRPDVIRRAVIAQQTHRRQRQGRNPMAGKKTTAESRGTGMGTARVPRLKGPSGRAALAPGTVGGRQAFPPTSAKKIKRQIPRKERRLALLSAIAATASRDTIQKRGHSLEGVLDIPLIVTDDIESLNRTKEVEDALINLGALSDLYRVQESRTIRAGKGKKRGRRIKQAIGPLIVISQNKGIIEAGRNLLGVNISTVQNLNPETLAPGAHPGRLTIWTAGAIQQLDQLYGKILEKEAR
jgi:large subunit ribosomal protein L4e